MKEDKRCIIGVDIGGTFFRIGAVDQEQNILQFQKVRVRNVIHSENVLDDLCNFLIDFMTKVPYKADGISIGFPATIDRNRTMVVQAPNIRFMEQLPVKKYLEDAFHIPVYIERDVCMTMEYDLQKYHISDCELVTGCYFGTGIGNAVYLNGRPLLGKNGAAGEIGHIPVDGSKKICGCGNVGCMESLAGGKYLNELAENAFTGLPIGEIFIVHGNDPRLKKFVQRMAQTVATEINILDPDYMIIGGGVPNMKDFPKEYFIEMTHKYVRKPFPEQNLTLIFAEDLEEKSVIGAALYARKMKEKA